MRRALGGKMHAKGLISFLSLGFILIACGGGASGGAASSQEEVRTRPALTDAQLADAIANAHEDLGEAEAKKLIDDTIFPVATTARLKLLNDFVPTISTNSNTSYFLAGAMEGIVWGTPRDLTSTPPGFGGQKLTTTVEVDSGIAAPTKLKISGVAAAAYTLDFIIAGFHVKGVHVPAGSSEGATAALIGHALDASNAKIMDTIGADATFAPLGGDHSQSPSGVDDLEISVSRGTIEIVVAQNG